MRARGEGTVINVASFAGWHFSELTGPAYTASKAGMMALTHSFNIEEGVNGLRATALCPGEVATPILKKRPVEPSAGRARRACCRRKTSADDPLHRRAAARASSTSS